MTGDSLTPEQPPSGPLYARESDETPGVGTQRGAGVRSGAQAGTESLGLEAGPTPCTASITNEHSRGTHHCVLEAGHQDPEWGGDHAGPEDENGTRYRWSDKAIGAVPHQAADQPAPAPSALRDLYAAAIASYDHAVGQATDPAPRGHHYGQADAALAVRDQELEQLRAQVDELEAKADGWRHQAFLNSQALARVRQLAERWENALAPDLAYARALRRALNPQEQP